jgi:tripartite-type tricarboxylate transporter receptor subunit TctC
MTLREWLVSLLATLCSMAAHAQPSAYPNKPVRMIVAFAPGGPNDVMARMLAAPLSQATGVQFLVDNRPGAGGTIGTDAVAKAPPDGYTLLFTSAPFTMAPALYAKLPYDTEKDFAAVTKVAVSPMVFMVGASSPYKRLQDILRAAKEHPGKLNYGSGGIASTPHVVTEALALLAGVKMTHVPFKGGGPALVALQGGEIDVFFESITSSLGVIQQGRVRALAVSTPKRAPGLPDVPTMEEAGLANLSVTYWVGVLAPARTPQEVVGRLHAMVIEALISSETRSRFAAIGAETVGNSPAEFQAFIRSELARWPRVVKEAQIQPQ